MQALQRVFHSGETSEHMADNDMKSSAAASSKANQLPLARDVRCTTSDVKPLRETSFESFGLKRELLLGIHEMGFEMPSPVQEKAIPEALKGRHVLARAKNGTGKTAAFMIPVLQKIDTTVCVPHKPQAIILVPTRELALQTSSICMALGKNMKVRVMVATGGTELHEDIMRIMQGVHVIVATPGRLLELLTPKKVWKDNVMFGEYCIIEPSQCKIAVLDEADKLLSADFAPLINDILGRLPADRQILLFSATFPVTIASFKDHLKPAPVVINLMNELTLKGITEFYVYLDEKNKVHCLNTLFRRLEISQAIIFVNSSRRAAILARKIFELGYSCYYIHSRMNQDFRNRIFHDFRHGTVRNLVCTDLFTRGIDVAAVNVVVNFDFPRMSETYLHRIGRSGRFGHLGIAINMVTDDDKDNLLRIERELNTQIRPIPKEIERSLYVGSCQPNNVSGEEILAKAMKKMTLDHQDGGAGCGADADKSGAHGQMKTEMVA